MSLTIKGIEAAKPQYNSLSGKYVQTKLSDGDGLFLIVTENSKAWRARYFYMGKEQTLFLGKYPVVSLKEAREKNFLLRQELEHFNFHSIHTHKPQTSLWHRLP